MMFDGTEQPEFYDSNFSPRQFGPAEVIKKKVDFSKIAFDVNDLSRFTIGVYKPSPEDLYHMSQLAYNEAMDRYISADSHRFFTNTEVDTDMCGCDPTYEGCHCTNRDFNICVDGKQIYVGVEETKLIFPYKSTSIVLFVDVETTYEDFIKFCKLCNIKLESKYVI